MSLWFLSFRRSMVLFVRLYTTINGLHALQRSSKPKDRSQYWANLNFDREENQKGRNDRFKKTKGRIYKYAVLCSSDVVPVDYLCEHFYPVFL